MTHDEMDAADMTTRYVMRRLTADEEQAFEEHLLDCEACQDDVEREMALRDGLREIPPAPAPVARRPGAFVMSILAAAAAVLLGVSLTLGIRLSRASSELQAAHIVLAGLERRVASADRSTSDLRARVASTERPTDTAGAAAIVFLQAVRSGSDSGPINKLTIAAGIKTVTLSIELAQPADAARFTAVLRNATGADVWHGGPLVPYSTDTLALSIDATLLHDGDYVLTLERDAPDGGVTTERRTFRVVARP